MYVLSTTHVAERAYVPEVYDGKITLFRGQGLYDDPELGWAGLAATIEPVEIAGGAHRVRRDMMNEPIVAALAVRFAAALHEAQRHPSERTTPGTQAGKVPQPTMAVTSFMRR
jgi:thioesterase domain-containing protein